MPLANAVPRNIPKMYPKFISMGEKYPSNMPTAIPITNLSSQCTLLSSFYIKLVEFKNLKNLYHNVCENSPKCLLTKNPANVGRDVVETVNLFK